MTSSGYSVANADPYVNPFATSAPSTIQNTADDVITQIDEKITVPATSIIATIPTRPHVQDTWTAPIATASTTIACISFPVRRKAKSSAQSWNSAPNGRISSASNVP